MAKTPKPAIVRAFLADVRERTESPDAVMRLIIAYKAVSAVLLLALALFLLGLIVDREWDARVRDIVVLTGLRTDNRFLSRSLLQLGFLSRRTTTALGVISLFYALLETTEVLGLLARRRWAEYLVLVATLVFLPYEALELARQITGSKLAILIINVAIVVYFVRSKGLFRHPARRPVRSSQVAAHKPALTRR